ncbi:MAG: FtsX-like permease family protein [Bacteroidota bacterium]
MKFELFIALKNLKNEVAGKKVSRPIVKISIISISLAMLVNIITIAVVIGFQNEVSNKVLGFGSHAFVNSASSASLFENEPILKKQVFLSQIKNLPFVKNVQAIAYKPAILQSDKSKLSRQEKQTSKSSVSKNTAKRQEIQSVLVKGVDEDYNFDFFKENLIAGRLPNYKSKEASEEIIISKRIANDLNYQVGDRVSAFFVKNQPIKKFFKLVGIFETGMEDFDKKMIVSDIRQIQLLNDWGIKSEIQVLDTLTKGHLVIKADINGGNGNYRYDWGKGYENFAGFIWYPTNDTIFRLITSDYWMFIDGRGEENTLPDTSYLKATIELKKGETDSKLNLPFITNADGTVKRKFISDTKFDVYTHNKTVHFEKINGKGSYQNYIGSFEINFHSWENFDTQIDELKKIINFNFSNQKQDLKVSSIKENQQEIFVWLAFLDINVWIIIILMLIIGIINMGSALLVMILLKTPFIGLMKSLGANSWSIRKIFLYQVSFLILRGMFWGNLIGVGLCLLQDYFKIIKLNPEVYYLNAVPIELNLTSILLINVVTLIVCSLAMIIPSYVITRINPSKSIRFN